MYLKEIKMTGFKSFATKTNIEFTKGITGVVGPNGSGKSNLLDAVKWVLGEQSIKTLRGSNSMTDVIFSGSKSRNSANLASVTLIFDNSDKHIATSFEEVAIRRIIYKSGENEYQINGEKCRLKDVTELFLDSGSSKEAFNIISQGEVQNILSNKPEDRRIIFEEAAGVLKYKKRKIEALRKLDKTNNNVTRINDIMTELENSREPLKEQSEKATRYLEIKDDFEDLEIALIVNDITELNKNYKNYQLKIEEILEEITKSTTTSSKEEAILMSKKNELAKIDLAYQTANKKLIETIAEKEKLNSQKNIIVEKQKHEVEDQRLHNELLMLKEEQHKKENQLKTIAQELENLNKTIQETNLKVENQLQIVKKIRSDKLELQNEIDKNIKKQSTMMYQIDRLRESIESNSGMAYSVKNILNNPRLKGIHNVIGKLVDTKEEYALAIDTALGAAKEFIIVDNQKAASKAIDYLKENKLGRATFFPLNIIMPRRVDEEVLRKAKNEPGFIGIASDLVKYEKEYEKIIKNQLGHILIVEDLEAANKLSKLISHRYKIVSVKGDLVHIGGSLTGGSRKSRPGMIKEKYELDNLINEHANIKQQIKKLEEESRALNEGLNNKEEILSELLKTKYNLEEKINNQKFLKVENENQLDNLLSEIDSTNSQLENNLSSEEEKIISLYYEEVQKQTELETSIARLDKEKQNLQEEISDYEIFIRKANKAYSEKQEELKELEIKTSRMDVKLDSLLNTLNEDYSLTYEHAKEKHHLELEVDIARPKVNKLRRELKELGTVNLGSIEEYERVNNRFNFLNTQLEDLNQAKTTLLEIIEEMDIIMKEQFSSTFEQIKNKFGETFKELFGGGKATLNLTDPENTLETGIEIIASPPGKKLTTISLLSGGEKSLTAIALLFAILKVRPVPYCILDEVEAALDDANVENFGQFLNRLKEQTQFIVITHKKKTMEFADVLYGITMAESGVSKLVSVRLEEADKYTQK